MNKDEIVKLVEELHALYVWPQFVADHHADVLLPRQTKGLYDVGKLADKAADALTTLSAENEALKHDVQRQMAIAIEHVNESATLSARVETLETALVAEREDDLWNAYNTGHVKDDRWSHMFMSDGEWLAVECGFDCNLADFDDAAIRAAIPVAARKALGGSNG